MNHTKLTLAACAALAALTAPGANATEFKLVLTGIIDLNLGGMFFDDVFLTLSGYGDSDDTYVVGGDTAFTPLTGLTADVLGYGSFPVPSTIQFFSKPSLSLAGFYDTATSTEVLTLSSSAFKTYHGTSALPVTPVGFVSSNSFHTPYGNAQVLGSSDLSFSAAAVPEPATWAMVIAGVGVVGAALRGRKTVSVRYA